MSTKRTCSSELVVGMEVSLKLSTSYNELAFLFSFVHGFCLSKRFVEELEKKTLVAFFPQIEHSSFRLLKFTCLSYEGRIFFAEFVFHYVVLFVTVAFAYELSVNHSKLVCRVSRVLN